jgi:glutamine synthetase
MSFAAACGVADAARAAACEAVARRMRDQGVALVRIGWCDTHGILRGKTLTAAAVPRALASGIGMASTILL